MDASSADVDGELDRRGVLEVGLKADAAVSRVEAMKNLMFVLSRSIKECNKNNVGKECG